MAKYWNSWGRNQHWENKDLWQQYGESESNYGWLKKTVIAVVIFVIVYGAQVSDTVVGHGITDGLHRVLTTETDFGYAAALLAKFAPRDVDVAVLKRIKETVTKSADPLLYMTKPVDGKLLKLFGWHTDPVTKGEKMNDGITIEATSGVAVKAAAQGRVKAVTDSAQFGRILIIEHSQDVDTVYGQLGEVLVKTDDMVSQGQIVARVGKPLNSAVAELYFEVREKGKAIDPLNRIKSDTSTTEGK
ncbi:MAG: Peptidase [Firmicutes bacterium]|nr:Peptidase [Bacillota bacterium]